MESLSLSLISSKWSSSVINEWDINWASTRQNLSSGFLTKRDSNQSPQLQRLARNFKISLVASLEMILSKTRITKALISLRGCAGWSAALFFANPEDRFSRVEAQLVCMHGYMYQPNHRSTVIQWYSACLEIEGLRVRASPEALRCVLEQDTLSSA